MPERIHKLQPDRTIQLRGFDDLGAAAAIHSATANSFKVSGVFRDAADFAVLVLYDADNFYEHPSIKYLPDTNFDGIVLTFDVHYAGLQPLDSVKYPTISWPFLEVIRPDNTTAQIRLFDYATQVGGAYTKAQATVTVVASGVQPWDRVTLWYLNYAFDYVASGGETAEQVAAALAAQINGAHYAGGQAIEALVSGAAITIRAARPGRDGNMITLYTESKTSTLRLTPAVAKLAGGSSDATWRISLDFTALGIPQIRQCWLTFAPELADGAAFTDTEWEATFTNWTVLGENKWLQVAGPGSLRIEEGSAACRYAGTSWSQVSGFFSGGFARKTGATGDSVTVQYSMVTPHDLYVGTSLYSNRGLWSILLDGQPLPDLDTYLPGPEPVNTRRRIAQGVPAGSHTVTLTLAGKNAASAGTEVYFDFLEAVVPSDIPAPRPVEPALAPALDYSTDHTYKLPPARILWAFDQLGFGGPMNEYIGVFWWNQRRRVNAVIPSVTVAFTGQFVAGDQIFFDIGGQIVGKTVFPNESNDLLARHFEYFINATYVGVWAAAAGNTVTVTVRSPKPAYSYSFQAWADTQPELGSTGQVSFTGSLTGGQPGIWEVDPAQEYGINRGARAWHADMFSLLAARGREIVVATSMELVFPPPGFAAVYADGQPVQTSIGFGGWLHSTHCAFNSLMLAHHTKVYTTLAGLMRAAGLTPNLQFGEFLWWFFSNYSAANPNGGMAYYDDETQAAALASLGRPLHIFRTPDDDPSVNGGADAIFLRNRLRDYVAALIASIKADYPEARFEVMFPYDVNHPQPAGLHQLGGALNRFVNLPVEWERKETSGFDRLKIEALDFGATRNLDLARTAIHFPVEQLAWPRDSLRYLAPVFGPGYPWEDEYRLAQGLGYGAVNLWAFDHISIYGLTLRPPRARSRYMG